MTMDNASPRIRSLMRQADRIAENGKRAAAEKMYRQILEEAPDTASAWLGLAGVLSDPSQQETAYEQVLALDPENQPAQTGLAVLRGEEPPAAVEAEEAEPPVDATAGPYDQGRDWLEAATAPLDVSEPPRPLPISRPPASQPPVSDSAVAAAGVEALDEHADHATHDVAEAEQHEVLFCANHPGRETNLRCNRCGKPICSSCARPTPVGYRCPECIREQEDVFFSATLLDYFLAALVTLPLALIGGALAARIGFLVIFLAAFAGSLIGRLAFRAARRHRGRWLPHVVATVVAIGGVLPAFPYLIALMFGSFTGILGLVWLGIYVVVATGAAFYQVK